MNLSSVAIRFMLTCAHVDERDALPELVENIVGLLIADTGLIRPEIKDVTKQGIDLQTPLRATMKDERPHWFVKRIVSTRRSVETVIGKLTERFRIKYVRAKKLSHFLRRITRKILAHTIAFTVDKKIASDNLLQFGLFIIT